MRQAAVGAAHYFVGLDLGKSQDHSALAVVERDEIFEGEMDYVNYTRRRRRRTGCGFWSGRGWGRASECGGAGVRGGAAAGAGGAVHLGDGCDGSGGAGAGSAAAGKSGVRDCAGESDGRRARVARGGACGMCRSERL